MDRVIRALLVAAAAAQLRVAWLVWRRLGDGSICDYPSDCLQGWFPASFGLVRTAWLLGLGAAALAVVLAWRARWSNPALATIGVATVSSYTTVAITPIVWGAGPMGPSSVLDGHLWLRGGVEGFVAMAVLSAVGAVMIAATAVLGSRGTARPRVAALWWPLGAVPPLVVMTFGIAADAGRFIGLDDDTAGRLATAPFVLLLVGGGVAAYRRSLPWVVAAALAVLALEGAVLATQASLWNREIGGIPSDLVVRGVLVAVALVGPLAVTAWAGAAGRPARQVGRQELENTAGPPS